MRTDELLRVVLLDLPVEQHKRSAEHMDALQREFELIRLSEDGGDSVPSRLIALTTAGQRDFGGVTSAPSQAIQEAIEGNVPSIDVEYLMPVAAADLCQRLSDLLDEADDYCRAGEHLLTLATPPDAVRYRRWFLGQMVAQIAGHPPTPWSEHQGDDDLERSTVVAGGDDDGDGALSLPEGWTVTGGAEDPVLTVTDDLDLHSAPVLREAVAQLMRSGGRRVTIDLTNAPFVDSVGLSVLVSAHARLRDSDATLSLVAPRNVRRVMTLSGLDGLLDIRPAD